MPVLIYDCYIALGANHPDKLEKITTALRLIDYHIGKVITASDLYTTEPWGESNQDAFLNQCIRIATNRKPKKLISECQKIEQYLGKKKISKYGPRSIDIDILFIDQLIIEEDNLIVPHPKLHERNFVLIPLAQIAPDFIHPIFNKSVELMLEQCSDQGKVELFK